MKLDSKRNFLVRKFLKEYLDLHRSKEDEQVTVEYIRNGVEFKGTNLWILIFATVIASLGLNVNSTAVIIGAMLISPLMGPTMGIGLSIGLNDFELMKRSLKSYAVTTLFSVVTATLYFLFTPLDEVQSELLARTSPSIYDVFIALMGGLAGIVALATKEKGNVIPGVAIATALMPPLCTAGFGLATGNLLYFLGAFYLYFINSVFISLATYIGVRLMRFERKQFVDKERERIVKRYIVWITIATMCPAVYLTYNIVRETFYQTSANRFITQELQFPDSQILSRDISYEKREIRVVLVGKEIPENQIVEARNRLDKYSLDNTKLVVFQGLGNNNAVDISNIKSMVMEDFYHNSERQLSAQRVELDSIKRALDAFSGSQVDLRMGKEMKVLFPMVKTLSVSKSLQMLIDSARMDTVTFAIVGCTHAPSAPEKRKMNDWLKARTGADKVHLIVE
ncbi:TIGR00341 family protein [Bacteroides gallinaceum]|uniref:TIGR00341 family protein n=2 Tax=Bacteroidaceae TaxID=815 RepID=A0ABT7VK14_9BACE|nr:TIGR00341 family protein [Bacteroides gallinaceum]MBU3855339.1 TIGR00341 family protein [Candidatus Phocaeicola excrementipullorum]MDM8326005.1 TIGR00341 family protein [Bacteroides gallinaceum]